MAVDLFKCETRELYYERSYSYEDLLEESKERTHATGLLQLYYSKYRDLTKDSAHLIILVAKDKNKKQFQKALKNGIKPVIDNYMDITTTLVINNQVSDDDHKSVLAFILLPQIIKYALKTKADQWKPTKFESLKVFIQPIDVNSAYFIGWDLVLFLERRIQTLEQSRNTSEPLEPASQQQKNRGSNHRRILANNTQVEDARDNRSRPRCDLSQGSHWLHRCFKFIAMSPQQRGEVCRSKCLCMNCLNKSHSIDRRPSASRCLICQGKHHTKLHIGNNKVSRSRNNAEETSSSMGALSGNEGDEAGINTFATLTRADVLLATAMVLVVDTNGRPMPIRALIDPCSEGSFLSQRVANQLHLSIGRVSLDVVGMGATVSSRACSEVECEIRSSRSPDFARKCSMIILQELTRLLPQKTVKVEDWPHVKGLVLADPQFNVPARIDCVLGTDAYQSFILDGLRNGPDNTPVAQKTVFGWILTGAAFQASNLERSTIRALPITTEPFAGTTDVEKMFRQIRVHPDDVDWQPVLWRKDSTNPIEDFRCTTVTYGSAAAPFLALRVMKQLAKDGSNGYPEASHEL
uniref:Peptidase aspartic putative domain-containing protein n=2 Tax=Trichogramma kaykai TaxID=54128 RepID=A0ABD2X8U6_9HYME